MIPPAGAGAGAGAAPPPKTTAPASWRITLLALGITWGGLVGGRGHRKGQLCVLGSPSALRTREPRTGGPPGGRGVRGPDFVLRKSLDTYLRVLKPACGPPGPLGYPPAAVMAPNQKAPHAATSEGGKPTRPGMGSLSRKRYTQYVEQNPKGHGKQVKTGRGRPIMEEAL
jgi:hypothetical protein